MQQNQPSLVLSDLRLPEGDGFGVLRASKEIDPDVPVIVMTAYGSIEDAVSAMKEGALDFLAKPVDPDHLMLLVSRALEQRRLVTENLLMREELAIRRGAPQLVGEDPSLRKLVRRAAAGGGDRHDRAHRRGERHGQRAVRAFAPRAEPAGGRARLSRSTARRSPRTCSRRSCSGTRRERSRGPSRESSASSRWRTVARCSSTRSARCRWRCRRRFCGPSRSVGSSVSAARRPCRSTSGSWPRRIVRCAPRSRRGASGRISTSACRSSRSRFRRSASGQETSRFWRATSSSASAAT